MGKKIKPDEDSVRAEKAKASSEGAERKRLYLADKKRLLELEKDNYTQLYLLQNQDGWWKMLGHSAIIFKYYVAQRLKMAVKLHPDTDYDSVSREGCVLVQDPERLAEKLKTLKIYPVSRKERGWVFELGEKISKEDYNLMLQEEERVREHIEQMITPKVRAPELMTRIKDANKVVWECTRKMDKVARDVFALEMSQRMTKLQVMVIRASRGTAELDDALVEALDIMEDLYGYTSLILNFRLLESKKTLELAETLAYLEKAIRREIKAQAAAKAEAEAAKKVKKKRKTVVKKDGKQPAEETATV